MTAGGSVQIAGRIGEAMAQVQQAFKKQLAALDEFRFINLESEMDVLADMLRSDGLTADTDMQESAEKSEPADDPFAALFAQEGK